MSLSKTRLLFICFASSVLLHILLMQVFKMFGSYDFGAPVNRPQVVLVDLASPQKEATVPQEPQKSVQDEPVEDDSADAASSLEPEFVPDAPVKEEPEPLPKVAEKEKEAAKPEPAKEIPSVKVAEAPVPAKASTPLPAVAAPSAVAASKQLPNGGQFAAAKYEKLSYALSILGFTVGTAELESKCEDRVTTITLRVKTNTATSAFFPVDDVVETQQVDGKYIMTTIRQLENSFRSDEMFTINKAKKKVRWVDRLHSRSLQMTVPSEDVLDTLSGIYSLRNRQLEVGKNETLHIYDAEVYADVPVEILRKEEMRLPNLTKIRTIVVRPLQKTAGIFRRTGEVLIWMTDDEFKVPVKIVTSMALGKVTAELISAESKPEDKESTQ